MKKWYASKTIHFALLKILGGLSAAISTGSIEPLIVTGLGVIDIILRAITNTAIRNGG